MTIKIYYNNHEFEGINKKGNQFYFNNASELLLRGMEPDYCRGFSEELSARKFLNSIPNVITYYGYSTKDNEEVELDSNFESNFIKDFPYCDFELAENLAYASMRDYGRTNAYQYGVAHAVDNNDRYVIDQLITRYKILYAMLFKEYPVQIEMISKIPGFTTIITQWMMDRDNHKCKRAFKKGKNIDEITSMKKHVWKELLLLEPNIDMWDVYRIWNGKISKQQKAEGKPITGLTKEEMELILNLNLYTNELDKFRKIIDNSVDVNGRKLFTISSLAEYLERVDMYQAIPKAEAIEILSDYVRMCKQLNVVPNVNSNSLKREHDVAARNFGILAQQKHEEWNRMKGKAFEERAAKLSAYEFENNELIAVVPKTISDLINEGCNNHNCVGSYVDTFSKGRANIFFVRKKASPEKSYITVELNSDCTATRQVYYACNRPVTNPVDLSFIKQWLNNNREINTKKEN